MVFEAFHPSVLRFSIYLPSNFPEAFHIELPTIIFADYNRNKDMANIEVDAARRQEVHTDMGCLEQTSKDHCEFKVFASYWISRVAHPMVGDKHNMRDFLS